MFGYLSMSVVVFLIGRIEHCGFNWEYVKTVVLYRQATLEVVEGLFCFMILINFNLLNKLH